MVGVGVSKRLGPARPDRSVSARGDGPARRTLQGRRQSVRRIGARRTSAQHSMRSQPGSMRAKTFRSSPMRGRRISRRTGGDDCRRIHRETHRAGAFSIFQVAGTLDRVVERSGELFILDPVKTGHTLDYSWGSTACQESLYAHGETLYDPDTRRHSPEDAPGLPVRSVTWLTSWQGRGGERSSPSISSKGWTGALLADSVSGIGARGEFRLEELTPTRRAARPPTGRREWLVGRGQADRRLDYADAGRALAQFWPIGVPTFKAELVAQRGRARRDRPGGESHRAALPDPLFPEEPTRATRLPKQEQKENKHDDTATIQLGAMFRPAALYIKWEQLGQEEQGDVADIREGAFGFELVLTDDRITWAFARRPPGEVQGRRPRGSAITCGAKFVTEKPTSVSRPRRRSSRCG